MRSLSFKKLKVPWIAKIEAYSSLSELRNEFANLESQDREDYQGRVNRSSTIHC